MNESQNTFFVDEEVVAQVLAIVRNAREHAVLVSPFLDLWNHARDAIGLAAKRGVEVTVLLRREPGVLGNPDVAWLVENGARVMAAERLHAKIYFNERDVLVSSMNLTEGSTTNSMDVALAITDEQLKRQIRGYVTGTLMRLASPVNVISAEAQPKSLTPRPGAARAAGRCIRCGRPIGFDPARPLCSDCYSSWADWSNEDYPEQFCHACGSPSDVSYARPFCPACFRKFR